MLPPIYNATTKSLIVGFASLFDDISYYSEDTPKKIIKVPITYAAKEKWLSARNMSNEVGDNKEVKFIYPALAFELVGLNLATDRMTNPANKIFNSVHDEFSLNKVPYDFQFNVYITTKKFDDSLKIVEQILPYFTPEISITITDNALGLKSNVPVVLTGSSYVIDYESDYSTSRDILWTLTFNIKSFLYPPVKIIDTSVPITSGNICAAISTIPGVVSFSGNGKTSPPCAGSKDVDFTYVISGYIKTTTSRLFGTITATKTNNTTFQIPVILDIVIKNNILYGEVIGNSSISENPIKAISFTFNFDITKLPIDTCRPIAGTVSCTAGSGYKLIKKTIVDVAGDEVSNTFDRLMSTVDPYTANKTDDYIIVDSSEFLEFKS